MSWISRFSAFCRSVSVALILGLLPITGCLNEQGHLPAGDTPRTESDERDESGESARDALLSTVLGEQEQSGAKPEAAEQSITVPAEPFLHQSPENEIIASAVQGDTVSILSDEPEPETIAPAPVGVPVAPVVPSVDSQASQSRQVSPGEKPEKPEQGKATDTGYDRPLAPLPFLNETPGPGKEKPAPTEAPRETAVPRDSSGGTPFLLPTPGPLPADDFPVVPDPMPPGEPPRAGEADKSASTQSYTLAVVPVWMMRGGCCGYGGNNRSSQIVPFLYVPPEMQPQVLASMGLSLPSPCLPVGTAPATVVTFSMVPVAPVPATPVPVQVGAWGNFGHVYPAPNTSFVPAPRVAPIPAIPIIPVRPHTLGQ